MTTETATLTELPALTQAKELEREGSALVAQIDALLVVDQPSFEAMAKYGQLCRRREKAADALMDPLRESAHAHWKMLVATQKALKASFVAGREISDQRLAAYEQAQRVLVEQAEEARRQEQERLEADARAVAEAETKRLQALADEAALAVAIQAEEQGDAETAEQILAQPVFVPPVAPQPVFAPPVQVAQPQVDGVSFRDAWTFEIIDVKAIPHQYMTPDLVKIGGVVRALKGSTNIPGIRVVNRRTTAQRA